MHGTALNLPKTALAPSAWWQRLNPDSTAGRRLWLFPCIGTGSAAWRPWASRLASAAELVALCLPGREARLFEAPYTRMDKLANALAVQLAPWVDERDLFCGHGVGGLVAFEVARRLRAADSAAPGALIVCGSRAPHQALAAEPLHLLSPRQFLDAVEARYGAVPTELRKRPEFLELLLPTLRADLEMMETYTYAGNSPLEIPLLAIAGASDPVVDRRSLASWRNYTADRFETAQIPGKHFIAIENPDATATRVRQFLAAL
jgi:medium-chain acyl-[acyl-carrier-protein] hydrolase